MQKDKKNDYYKKFSKYSETCVKKFGGRKVVPVRWAADVFTEFKEQFAISLNMMYFAFLLASFTRYGKGGYVRYSRKRIAEQIGSRLDVQIHPTLKQLIDMGILDFVDYVNRSYIKVYVNRAFARKIRESKNYFNAYPGALDYTQDCVKNAKVSTILVMFAHEHLVEVNRKSGYVYGGNGPTDECYGAPDNCNAAARAALLARKTGLCVRTIHRTFEDGAKVGIFHTEQVFASSDGSGLYTVPKAEAEHITLTGSRVGTIITFINRACYFFAGSDGVVRKAHAVANKLMATCTKTSIKAAESVRKRIDMLLRNPGRYFKSLRKRMEVQFKRLFGTTDTDSTSAYLQFEQVVDPAARTVYNPGHFALYAARRVKFLAHRLNLFPNLLAAT